MSRPRPRTAKLEDAAAVGIFPNEDQLQAMKPRLDVTEEAITS